LFVHNFVVVHRVAEWLARQFVLDYDVALERRAQQSMDSGVPDSIDEVREYLRKRHPLPTRRDAIGQILNIWGAWKGSRGPSSRALRLYRSALGSDVAVRAFADQQILEVLKEPSQRIIMGPGMLELGPYVPNRAASPSLNALGRSYGPIVLQIKPSFEQRLVDAGVDLSRFGLVPSGEPFPQLFH
jgi:hypothetical protein